MPPFDLGSLLQQYLEVPAGQSAADAPNHFEQVAQHAPTEVVSQGISDTLRSKDTPPLGQMVSEMFSRANPQQQAGMLNEILGALNPGVLTSLGGVLGGLASRVGGGHVQVSPQQVSEVSPQQVQDLANHAEQHSPGIFDRLGDFYAQHPDLVQTLGTAALTVALAKIAGRMRR
jgi:hypothetical protein